MRIATAKKLAIAGGALSIALALTGCGAVADTGYEPLIRPDLAGGHEALRSMVPAALAVAPSLSAKTRAGDKGRR